MSRPSTTIGMRSYATGLTAPLGSTAPAWTRRNAAPVRANKRRGWFRRIFGNVSYKFAAAGPTYVIRAVGLHAFSPLPCYSLPPLGRYARVGVPLHHHLHAYRKHRIALWRHTFCSFSFHMPWCTIGPPAVRFFMTIPTFFIHVAVPYRCLPPPYLTCVQDHIPLGLSEVSSGTTGRTLHLRFVTVSCLSRLFTLPRATCWDNRQLHHAPLTRTDFHYRPRFCTRLDDVLPPSLPIGSDDWEVLPFRGVPVHDIPFLHHCHRGSRRIYPMTTPFPGRDG